MSRKTKLYTRKLLHRAARKQRAETAAEAREDRALRRKLERDLRRMEAAFKGCEVDE